MILDEYIDIDLEKIEDMIKEEEEEEIDVKKTNKKSGGNQKQRIS